MQVQSVGLNFKDILVAMGAYPMASGNPGSDCAGLLLDGPGVRLHGALGFAAGRPVAGMASGCLGTQAVAVPELIVRLGPATHLPEAAAAVTVCSTAIAALSAVRRPRWSARW